MKVMVYGLRQDEKPWFEKIQKEYLFEVSFTELMLDETTVDLAEGCQAVFIVAMCRIGDKVAAMLKKAGVHYVLTRSAGYDHINLQAIRQEGILAANVPVYSRHAVSEYTVLMILALIKGFGGQLRRTDKKDFRLTDHPAAELAEMTLGLFGAGTIGAETLRLLHAFGCKLLVCDPYRKRELEGVAEYVGKEEIFRESDLIFFHCNLSEDNYHLISEETIAQMKYGVYLVNTARGELMDSSAVLHALKDGKIAGLAVDVYEGENCYVRKNCNGIVFGDTVLEELLSLPNVILTPHVAFHTQNAVQNQIRVSFENLLEFTKYGTSKNQIR